MKKWEVKGLNLRERQNRCKPSARGANVDVSQEGNNYYFGKDFRTLAIVAE
jgi:hypothetical protein